MSEADRDKRLFLLMRRSRDELDIVKKLISNGNFSVAISRSYYSTFYAATAVMMNLGKEFSKHSALGSALGKEFATKDETGKKIHRIFLDLFEIRHEADYILTADPNEEEALKYLDMAREFHEWAKTQLPEMD